MRDVAGWGEDEAKVQKKLESTSTNMHRQTHKRTDRYIHTHTQWEGIREQNYGVEL